MAAYLSAPHGLRRMQVSIWTRGSSGPRRLIWWPQHGQISVRVWRDRYVGVSWQPARPAAARAEKQP